MRHPIAVVALLFAAACKGPPARLAVGASDSVVVNNRLPVRLAVHAFDARGHALPDSGVRFEWMSGALTYVSPDGVATCDHMGDAVVRASLGGVATDVRLLCRPIVDLRVAWRMDLVAGDSAEPLPFEAIGLDGRPVALLAGSAKIMDSDVASLERMRVRPRAAGGTAVGLRVGDRFKWIGVDVYERVPTLAALSEARPRVAVDAALASGETRRWPLPRGHYLIGVLPDTSDVRLAVLGTACARLSWSRQLMCDSDGGATIVAYVPWSATPTAPAHASIAVHRLDPRPEPRPGPTLTSNQRAFP